MSSNTPDGDRIARLNFMPSIRRRWICVCVTIVATAIVVTCIGYVVVLSNGDSAHPTISDLVDSWRGARYLIIEVYEGDSQGFDYSAILHGATENDVAHGVLASRCVIFDRRTIVRSSKTLERFRYGRADISWAPPRIIRVYVVGDPNLACQQSPIWVLHIDELPEVIVLRDGRAFEFHCDDTAAVEWVRQLYLMAQSSAQHGKAIDGTIAE